MPQRFLFRMVYYQNLKQYLEDGALYAKNSPNAQLGYRISYDDIVSRRGTSQFTAPCGSNINEFVPFYFSPLTKMAFAIHVGNVPLKAPDSTSLGPANMNDVALIVVDPARLFASDRECWFTDIACNSAIPPSYENNPDSLASHVDWKVFDAPPITAAIPEIGYKGVCKYQHDQDTPIAHQQRSKKRMAEFMVKDHLRMDEVACIILKTPAYLTEVQLWIASAGVNIPVLVKPGCYF